MTRSTARDKSRCDHTTHELVMPNVSDSLHDIRAFTSSTISKLRLSKAAKWDIVLAVGEAATNCVLHGQNDDGVHNTITTRIESSADCVRIQLKDDGPGFRGDVAHWPTPDLTSEKGRGIFIIKTLMDDLEYPQVRHDTLCVLTKKTRRGH